MKIAFISSKKRTFFYSEYIQIFVFLSSLLFPLVSHCSRRRLKINLKIHDIINWLNKKLKTHVIWYLEKERRSDIETWWIDRVLNKEHLIENVCRKCAQKIDPDPFLILVNSLKQPLHARKSFQNKIFRKRIIKNLKQFNLFFFTCSPFLWISL